MDRLKKRCLENKILNEQTGEIFNKYAIDDTLVIFIQEADGKIDPEAVWIKLPERFGNMCLITKGDDYPTSINAHVDAFNCDIEDINEAIKQMEYMRDLSEEIMGIFNYGTHKELYDIHRKEV